MFQLMVASNLLGILLAVASSESAPTAQLAPGSGCCCLIASLIVNFVWLFRSENHQRI